MFINDVGQSTWEEINDGHRRLELRLAHHRRAHQRTRASGLPVFAYAHSGAGHQRLRDHGRRLLQPGHPASSPPATYGDYFFADFCSGWIRTFDPATGAVSRFATGISSPVDLQVASRREPVLPGARRAARSSACGSPPAQAPTIIEHPADRTVLVGQPATFTVAASGTAPLAYQWQRNGVEHRGRHLARATPWPRPSSRTTAPSSAAWSATPSAPRPATSAPPDRDPNRRPTATITPRRPGTLYTAGNTDQLRRHGHRPRRRRAAGGALHLAGRLPPRHPRPPLRAAHHRRHQRLVHDPDQRARPRPTSGTGSTSRCATPPGAPTRSSATSPRPDGDRPNRDRAGGAGSPPRWPTRPVPAHLHGGRRDRAQPGGPCLADRSRARTWVFASWSDGGARAHSISTPAVDYHLHGDLRARDGRARGLDAHGRGLGLRQRPDQDGTYGLGQRRRILDEGPALTGEGHVEFTVSEVGTHRMLGLSNVDTNQNWNTIPFAIHLNADGRVQIYEMGALRGTAGTHVTGDVLRVAVEGGRVRYRRNGTLLFTSPVIPTYPLFVDTALFTMGATLTDVVVSGDWAVPPPPPPPTAARGRTPGLDAGVRRLGRRSTTSPRPRPRPGATRAPPPQSGSCPGKATWSSRSARRTRTACSGSRTSTSTRTGTRSPSRSISMPTVACRSTR